MELKDKITKLVKSNDKRINDKKANNIMAKNKWK